jgi:hypothetical protein
MKTLTTWNFRSIVSKIMRGPVLAAMIGSISVAPALGKDDGKRGGGRQFNGRSEQRGRGHDRGYVRGRRYYQPYGYGYVPPPVIYAPAPPLGIGIFFPPIIIR